MSKICVAVEGGGTNTKFLYGPPGASPKFAERRASLKFLQSGIEVSVSKLAGMFGELGLDRIDAVAIGLSGASAASDQERYKQLLSEATNISRSCIKIESDSTVTFRSCPVHPSILLIAGTGSVAIGYDDDDKLFHIGGWGPIIGDEGSGYEIGRTALQLLLRTIERRSATGILTQSLRTQFQGLSDAEITKRLKSSDIRPSDYASLVFDAAEIDPFARQLVGRAAKGLSSMVSGAARLSPDSETIFLYGSVAKEPLMQSMLRERTEFELSFEPLEEMAPLKYLFTMAEELSENSEQ